MKTAEEMNKFSEENGYGKNGWGWGVKHFGVIEKMLLPDEEVLLTFTGLHNYVSMTNHESNFAYAITSKRLILAQKNVFAGEKSKIINLDNLNDITKNKGILNGVIAFDTIKETFNVNVTASCADKLYSAISELISDFKREKQSNQTTNIIQNSTADEILKFKNLLDAGIITQEEFDKKKKELLNI